MKKNRNWIKPWMAVAATLVVAPLMVPIGWVVASWPLFMMSAVGAML